VGQILSHVKHSIGRMPECLASQHAQAGEAAVPAPVSPAQLLAELESTYAMADERAVHHGGGGDKPKAAAPAETEITFF
jgi:methyl-accepting chemotaxis protein